MDSLRPEKLVSGRSDYFRIRLFLVAALFRNIIKEIIAVIQRCIHINVAYNASGHLLGHIISKLAVFGNRQELVSLARVAFQFKLCTLDRVESRRGIWHLTEAGERFLAIGSSEQYSRRRYLEPSRMFLRHSLAVSECYVQLVEICRRTPGLTLLTADWEPDCWRPYTQHGKIVSLKPDLFVATKSDGYEDRWFIEIDLSTESPSTVIGKCDRYRDYYRSGLEQKQFGVFPVVVWLVLDAGRKERLRSAIQEAYPKGGKLFIVITADEFERLIRQGFDAKDLC